MYGYARSGAVFKLARGCCPKSVWDQKKLKPSSSTR